MALDKDTIVNVAKRVSPEVSTYEHRGQLTLIIPQSDLLAVCTAMKEDPSVNFDMLLDVTAIDWAKKGDRFEVVYFLYSNAHKGRVRIKTAVDERKCECPSVTSIWESANWYERETYDMYGVKFTGHPGLRRFYMPEDFSDPETGEPYYPLRKDFPLMGVPDAIPMPPYPEKYGEVQ